MDSSAPREQAWHCFTLRLPADQSDTANRLCWETDALGCQEQPTPHGLQVRLYYSLLSDREWVEWTIRKLCEESGSQAVDLAHHLEEAPADRWMANFRDYFQGIQVGDFFVRPPWIAELPGTLNLKIDPSHAFGTGTHESTQLILQALRSNLTGVREILDIGSGSGILSIAAKLMAPEITAWAIDTDSDAVASARQNSLANNTPVGFIVGGPESVQGQFDLVLANLTRPILQRLAPELARLTHGQVLTSGYTSQEEHLVLDALLSQTGFRLQQRTEKRGWVCHQFAAITSPVLAFH